MRSLPLSKLIQIMLQNVVTMSWKWTGILALGHMLTTYLGFLILGELDLVVSWMTFIYYWVVTGSSVGYGDLSPTTELGKLFTALYVIPGALSIFAFVVGKAISTLTAMVNKLMNGLGDYSTRTGHTVVIGYINGQTQKLLKEIGALASKDLVLVTTEDPQELKSLVSTVRTASLNDRENLLRAGISGASHIVVLTSDDQQALMASLAVSAIPSTGHIVSFFQNQETVELVKAHCPEIETVVSTSVETMSRALVDPGASAVLMQLSSSAVDATLHSVVLSCKEPQDYSDLCDMMRPHRATLIGHQMPDAIAPTLDPDFDALIPNGSKLFYVARARINGETFTV